MPAAPLLGVGLLNRQVRVQARDVVFVKGILEASEGVAALFAEHGGELILAAHASRLRELDELLADLEDDIGAIVAPVAE
ncbi:MAG: DUF4911 domain-containing protein [Polyangiaceae bacterium]|nr:DUF4911 domain-containing protein [Polyangiaceae bacterium]